MRLLVSQGNIYIAGLDERFSILVCSFFNGDTACRPITQQIMKSSFAFFLASEQNTQRVPSCSERSAPNKSPALAELGYQLPTTHISRPFHKRQFHRKS